MRLHLAGITALFPRRVAPALFSPQSLCRDRQYGHDEQSCERAARLLARHLTAGQQRALRRHGFFTVRTRSGRQYRLWARRDLPVELIDNRNQRPRHKPWLYCVTTDVRSETRLPLADQMLELKLCLEADEDYFLMTANPKFLEGIKEKRELVRKTVGAKPA